MGQSLPPIPAKRYFTIGETGVLCDVKPHVLRYWEQEFTQLRPMKRAGNRRYYQHHEVLMIRKIRSLLYDKGFTISGARNQLQTLGTTDQWVRVLAQEEGLSAVQAQHLLGAASVVQEPPPEYKAVAPVTQTIAADMAPKTNLDVCYELQEILRLLVLD